MFVRCFEMNAIYVRISTAKQQADSQEQELLAYANRLNEGDPILFKDIISGKTRNRPALDDLMDQCRKGQINKILCHKLDRLGRSLLNLKEILAELDSLHIPVIFTSQGFSTENQNPASKLFLSMLGAFAEFEREIITERVRAGIAARIASGKPMGRKPITSDQHDQILAKRALGLPMRTIARELNLSAGTVHKVIKKAKP